MNPPPLFHLRQGTGRLVVSIPHAGTFLPPDIAPLLTEEGLRLTDTDWHVDRLYGFLEATDATVIAATHSRLVVDLNRGTDGAKLYPGRAETAVCPLETFAGHEHYAGAPPGAAEQARRIARYWQPYHTALAAELERARGLHGTARLLDAHSIAAEVPRLFEGRLPDLSFGTDAGRSTPPWLAERAMQAASCGPFSMVLDGRFKGGFITRHYGRAGGATHAIQLELAQDTYLDPAAPARFEQARAAKLIAVLERIVRELMRP